MKIVGNNISKVSNKSGKKLTFFKNDIEVFGNEFGSGVVGTLIYKGGSLIRKLTNVSYVGYNLGESRGDGLVNRISVKSSDFEVGYIDTGRFNIDGEFYVFGSEIIKVSDTSTGDSGFLKELNYIGKRYFIKRISSGKMVVTKI